MERVLIKKEAYQVQLGEQMRQGYRQEHKARIGNFTTWESLGQYSDSCSIEESHL